MKIKISSLLCLLLLPLFTGCNGSRWQTDKLKVMASFYIMDDFAKKIGGDKIELKSFISKGDAHDYEPTAKERILLRKADVFLYNGSGLEHWVDKELATTENENLLSVETSLNLTRED